MPTITRTALTEGEDDGGTSCITASVTPTANTLVFALVQNHRADSINVQPLTASGCSLTWSNVWHGLIDVGGTGRTSMQVLAGIGASPSTGGITFTPTDGASMTQYEWLIEEFPNAKWIRQISPSPVVGTGTARTCALGKFLPGSATVSFQAADIEGTWTLDSVPTYTASEQYDNVGWASLSMQFYNGEDTSVTTTFSVNTSGGMVALELAQNIQRHDYERVGQRMKRRLLGEYV